MATLNLVLLWVGVIVAVAGLYWLLIERCWLTPPLVATAAGVLLGPEVFRVFVPSDWSFDWMPLLEQVTRVTLALSLAGIATHLPSRYVVRHLWPLALVAVLGTLLMWLVCSGLTAAVFGTGAVSALVIGAALAPTDPVLAGSVVTGPTAKKNIRARLRHLLYAESASNDGLALAAVMLPILLATHASASAAWSRWVWHTILWQVAAGAALGAVVGLVAGKLQKISQRFKFSDERGMLPLILALALGVLGGLALIDADGLLAVFTAAVAFHYLASDALEGAQEHIQDAMQRFVQLVAFALLGVLLPWRLWADLGWRGAAIVAAVLLLRRLPVWLLLKPAVGPMKTWRDAAFLGWFGPIGLSAIYYATFAHRHLHDERVWPVVTLVVAASMVAHGITATPLARLMGRYEPPKRRERKPPGKPGAPRARRQATESRDRRPEPPPPGEDRAEARPPRTG